MVAERIESQRFGFCQVEGVVETPKTGVALYLGVKTQTMNRNFPVQVLEGGFFASLSKNTEKRNP